MEYDHKEPFTMRLPETLNVKGGGVPLGYPQ